MTSIAVFCGSSSGNEDQFMVEARRLGETLAKRGITLVYGGAQVGLMGAVADAVLAHQGRAIGVLPGLLQRKEIAHPGLTELILVDTMHERKMRMNDLCDGVIALPGGFGTMDELFEMLTWAQLGLHRKPIGLLNVSGFYDPLITMVQTMTDRGLLKSENQRMLLVSDDIHDLLDQMDRYQAPEVGKWISRENL